MPEPNLPPLCLDMDGSSGHPDMVSVVELAASLPELPYQTRIRLQEKFRLAPLIAIRLVVSISEPFIFKKEHCFFWA